MMKIKINSKFIFFTILSFILTLSFLIALLYNILISKINYYNENFNKGLNYISEQNFNEAILIFKHLYDKGYRTNSVAINCIYLYQILNKPDHLYFFIRKSAIDKGFDPAYNKYLNEIITSEYKNLIKIKPIDYLNITIIIFILLFSIIIFICSIILIKEVKKLNKLYFLIILINFIVICLFFIKLDYSFHRNEALSLSQSEVYNFPLPDSQSIFTIKEYMVVKIIKTFNDYILIKLPNGKRGWINKNNILKIF